MKELNKIYNEDCLVGMTDIEPNSIDCICCDLPYFKVVDAKFDNQWKTENEYLDWVDKVISISISCLRPGGSMFLFTSRQMNRKICNILDSYGLEEKRIIIWARKRGFNTTRGHALASGYEPIAYYTKPGGDTTFNNIKIKPKTDRKEYTEGTLKDGITLSDIWTDISALPHNAKEKVAHPTQKPLVLIKRILEISTNEGDTVLDMCMGSGTTAVAAKEMNRNFIGFEIDENYCKIANERLNNIYELT